MNLLRIFSIGIIVCSISESYSTASITLDFMNNNEYRVSMCSDSVNKSETFYELEEFPQKLNDVTDGLLSAESVSINNITRYKFNVDAGQSLCLHMEPNNIISNLNGLNMQQIMFKGINSNNSKPIKLFINGADDSLKEIRFDCDKNVVDFPDITVNKIVELELHTKLDVVITYYNHPQYNHIAFRNKSESYYMSIKPNERKGFTTTPNYHEYSITHNFKTKPSKELGN